MIPVLVGLDHRTAPLALRERLHADDAHLLPLLASLATGPDAPLREIVVLSTCNRYEVYATGEDPSLAQDAVVDCLLSARNVATQPLLDALYRKEGIEATRHLFRVAAGLESLVLGETQIMRQVADALAQAQEAGTCGALLSRLFTAALHTGKRARTETAISQHTLSISHAAALLVERELASVTAPRIVVVGAGEMASLAADALAQQGQASISLVNRGETRAREVAGRLGVQAHPWGDLEQAVAEADAVITATSARQPVLSVDDIAASRRDNPSRSLLLVDIGVPRNIAPAVHASPTIRLYDIDDLQAVVAQHWRLREAEVARVEAIIAGETLGYTHWLNSRYVVPVLTELRSRADAIAAAELEHALRRLPDLDAHERDVMAQMAQRIVHKLMHTPTVTLKSRAARGDHFDYDHAIRKLFALDPLKRDTDDTDDANETGSDSDDG
ncbi:MAG TPA: glutamyl-tRNA reductase [Ktedonobacterales bacterium]|nr:glutamyl-tRNA reductase [Ktedonobacterales bacterium]